MRWINVKNCLPNPNDMVGVMVINKEREEGRKRRGGKPRYITGTYTYPEFLVSIYSKNEHFGSNEYNKYFWFPLANLGMGVGDLAEKYDIIKWCLLPVINPVTREEVEKLNRWEILDL